MAAWVEAGWDPIGIELAALGGGESEPGDRGEAGAGAPAADRCEIDIGDAVFAIGAEEAGRSEIFPVEEGGEGRARGEIGTVGYDDGLVGGAEDTLEEATAHAGVAPGAGDEDGDEDNAVRLAGGDGQTNGPAGQGDYGGEPIPGVYPGGKVGPQIGEDQREVLIIHGGEPFVTEQHTARNMGFAHRWRARLEWGEMNTNSESFLTMVVQDQELRKRVLEYSMKEDYESIVALAAQMGLPCTVQELSEAYRDGKIALPKDFNEEEELTDDQLAHVAGGGRGIADKSER